jgi:uncharacterized glyoxalase superfamily protein PhnB
MLAVPDPVAAIEFYGLAFGATVRWRIGDPAEVAGLSVDGAEFFLAWESPPRTRAPGTFGATNVRIELFVEDPAEAFERAVAAGASEGSPVREHTHAIAAPQVGAMRMLQGSVVDPWGHIWLIGKFVDDASHH